MLEALGLGKERLIFLFSLFLMFEAWAVSWKAATCSFLLLAWLIELNRWPKCFLLPPRCVGNEKLMLGFIWETNAYGRCRASDLVRRFDVPLPAITFLRASPLLSCFKTLWLLFIVLGEASGGSLFSTIIGAAIWAYLLSLFSTSCPIETR